MSRVLNNRGYISEATRKKVYKAMEELNYQPNELARSLYRRKSNLIGVLIPSVSHPFFGQLTYYIEYYAHEAGYKILLCNSGQDSVKEKEYIDMLKRHQVDGIIMGSHTLDVEQYANINLPIVAIDRHLSDDIPYISSDNYHGGVLATELLLKKGCKKVAHISGPLILNTPANNRYKAFKDVVTKENVEHFVVETKLNKFEIDEYIRLGTELLEAHPDIDGIFASSDMIAAAIINVARILNKKIPEELKVVGYDDIELAALIVPPLTTIRQPIKEIAKKAIELILDQVDGKKVATENILPITLIERETT
ncbi:transcriptional regulator, LacI family [Caldanaerobius fijiensis DSM 17918]|uniref:Transcriptional regulator, LacI family n=1 Tax=Caldanaerobius fijiensis DSM 17918 TaxID=1121256 RepID=A0A1M5AIF6_9THEO|nr:transcriptional regulator, LacI family [Caldanaerobius fijiensis DSM 17918]